MLQVVADVMLQIEKIMQHKIKNVQQEERLEINSLTILCCIYHFLFLNNRNINREERKREYIYI